jgi:hypothetical protein
LAISACSSNQMQGTAGAPPTQVSGQPLIPSTAALRSAHKGSAAASTTATKDVVPLVWAGSINLFTINIHPGSSGNAYVGWNCDGYTLCAPTWYSIVTTNGIYQAFNPNGTYSATTTDDTIAVAWDVAPGSYPGQELYACYENDEGASVCSATNYFTVNVVATTPTPSPPPSPTPTPGGTTNVADCNVAPGTDLGTDPATGITYYSTATGCSATVAPSSINVTPDDFGTITVKVTTPPKPPGYGAQFDQPYTASYGIDDSSCANLWQVTSSANNSGKLVVTATSWGKGSCVVSFSLAYGDGLRADLINTVPCRKIGGCVQSSAVSAVRRRVAQPIRP